MNRKDCGCVRPACRLDRDFRATKSPADNDGASEQSAICGNQRMAYLPLASFYLRYASPKIPARLGAISRVIATYRITRMSESPLSGCVGPRQKFQNHHLNFIGNTVNGHCGSSELHFPGDWDKREGPERQRWTGTPVSNS